MPISEKEYTRKYLKIGQTYKIQIKKKNIKTDDAVTRKTKGKLIFQSKYFYTFEYKGLSGITLKETISTFSYFKNPALIKEA